MKRYLVPLHMPSVTSSLPLGLYILRLYGGSPCCQQAEALAPEGLFPELFPDLREFLLQQPAGCALVRVDELADLTPGLPPEHDMHMVRIMVPFLQGQPVAGCDIAEYLFRAVRNPVIKYFSPVLYDQDQVVVQEKD